MLQLSQLKVPYSPAHQDIVRCLAERLHIQPEEIRNLKIRKRSIDARKKPEIFYSYTVSFEAGDEREVLAKNRRNKNLTRFLEEPKLPVHQSPFSENLSVVVVGAGPAGLFAAYYLCLCKIPVTVVERGAKIEERTADVEQFWKEGILCPDSNVSFGEGGAGTFSDGKLNTGVKDRTGKKQFVLETFVRFGAQEEILYENKPHIGTDVLRKVIVNMRREMERLGCVFSFHTKVNGLIVGKDNRIQGLRTVQDGIQRNIECQRVILAIGHSARDTFTMLLDSHVALSQKSFAVGVRVQHNQADIDRIQYGMDCAKLPPASYKCTGKTRDGRGVYTFCMCPGGYVVNASTEQEALTVNGMSNAARDSGVANSAVIVTVGPKDFEGENPLAGVEFQRKWERQMYLLLAGKVPVQRYGDFKKDTKTQECGSVLPHVMGQWGFANLRRALPKFVIDGMIDGIESFGRKLAGFADEDTLLLGFEARTSSPVRIERGEHCASISHPGLYPCGEGAGYAGGIMSAAMDGLRVSMALVNEKMEKNDER